MTAPAPTDPVRTRDLALIHAAAKRRFGADRATYEALVFATTGATSCKDLDAPARARVMVALGIAPGPARAWRPAPAPADVTTKQWKYIGDLAVQLHLDERSFARLVKHVTGLDAWAWLDVAGARTLITALLKIQRYGTPARRVPSRGNPRRARPGG